MEKKYFIEQDTAWFCVSFFYSKKNWGKLIQEIQLFYEQKKMLLNYCIISLSEDKGEHIKLILSSSANKKYLDLIQKDIDKYFHSFISDNPSNKDKQFQYGEENLWCNYDNNSIEWNKFLIYPSIYNQYINYSQATSSLILHLLADNYSLSNVFSISIFLSTRTLKICSDMYRETPNFIVDITLKQLASLYRCHSIVAEFNLEEKLELYEIDYEETIEIIEEYWNDEEDSYLLYKQWENEVKKIITIKPSSFLLLNILQWNHFYINDYMKILIINLLKNYCLKNT